MRIPAIRVFAILAHQFAIDSAGNWYGANNLLGRTQKFVPKLGAATSHLMAAPILPTGGSR